MHKLAGMAALVGALGACAHENAVPTPVPPGKYALQLKLAAGQVRRYAVEVNLHIKASANDVPVMDAPMKMSYVDVLETGASGSDGATEMRERFENLEIAGEGQMVAMMKQMMGALGKVVVTSRIKPDGTVVSTKTEGAEGPMQDMARRMGRAKFNHLPKAPVGPGDSWTSEDKESFSMGMGAAGQLVSKAKHTFVKVEACGSKQCAVVESEVSTSIAEGGGDVSGSGTGHATAHVALDDAQPVQSSGTQELKFQGSQAGQPFEAVQKVTFTAQLR